MASTIRSTYIDLFHEVQEYYGDDLIIIVLSLLPPVEVAISRVYSRNGGKPINEEAVRGKWETVARNVSAFGEAGFTSITLNTAKIPKERMLRVFLKKVRQVGGV